MMSFSSSSARRNRVLYSSSGCNRAALGVARPPLPSILEASSFSVEEEASSSVRSRVGRGSGAISAAPATRESAPIMLLCKNATEETHTTARLECVVVVGKIAKDFADAIFRRHFFLLLLLLRVLLRAMCVEGGDFLRRSRRLFARRGFVFFAAKKNRKEWWWWWCPSFLKSRRRLLPPTPRVSKVKRVVCVRLERFWTGRGVHRTHLLHCFVHPERQRVLFLLRFEKSMQ